MELFEMLEREEMFEMLEELEAIGDIEVDELQSHVEVVILDGGDRELEDEELLSQFLEKMSRYMVRSVYGGGYYIVEDRMYYIIQESVDE